MQHRKQLDCDIAWVALPRALRVWVDMVHWPVSALPGLLDTETYVRGPAVVLGLLQARLNHVTRVFLRCTFVQLILEFNFTQHST